MRVPPPAAALDPIREDILDGIAVQRAMVADIQKENSPAGENPDGTYRYPRRTAVTDPWTGQKLTLAELLDAYSMTLMVLQEVHLRADQRAVLGNTGHAALLREQAGRLRADDAMRREIEARVAAERLTLLPPAP